MTAQQLGLDERYQRLRPGSVLLNPGATVVLKASRFYKFWLYVVGSVVLALAGIVVPTTGEGVLRQLAGVVLFCAGAYLFVIQFIRPDSLTFTADGFSVIALGRRRRYAWSDVAEFGVLEVPIRGGSYKQVGIRLRSRRSRVVRRLTSGPDARFDAVLPTDGYGLSVEDLAALMEEWRTAKTGLSRSC